MPDPVIELAEYVARRDKVLAALEDAGGAVGVVFAGDGAAPLSGFWEPDWNFYYLTGIDDEQGAAVMFDPRAEDPRRRCILFLRPLNPEREEWDGLRDRIGTTLKSRTGFKTVLRTNQMPAVLSTAARKSKRVACLHPFANYEVAVSRDLALFRKVTERTIGVNIDDQTDLLPRMRAVKSAAELAIVQKAVEASAAGYEAVLGMLRPGVGERAIQTTLETGFRSKGASGNGYNPIVGSGLNSTVLHYMANTATTRDGELVVIDAGAQYAHYTADITRTYPVSGRFTGEQRELYDLVLRAQEAAIKAVRPGVKMPEVDAAAREVIDTAGHADAFMHGIGHQLGIEVHDVTPDGPLRPGMVVTIEPGVYFADRKLGIRIEDDILVTAEGSKNLSAIIPKQAEEIEAALSKR
jgi:Xaa-Pro aminopeptidase